ncbi:MAG: ribosomal subunit interface protein [candidate division Zixibacteria bacterium 4484_93]|nr:MAG: ribosomal subunit interface protein [candidate division Zixibacteria bacterium 4484_93]RKZ33334.1 MAG: ribosome-associated translation inhibitor RaiA [bacterium]
MEMRISARHFELDSAIKSYAEKRLGDIDKYFNRITDAELILTKENYRYTAELILSVPQRKLMAKATDDELTVALDMLSTKIEAQLSKFKEKLKNHRP